MKKILLAYCILFWQIISCSIGTIEVKPEATKLLIQNNSQVHLLSVTWNGQNFEDISAGSFSEKIFSDGGNGFIYFKTSNGKKYHTEWSVECKQYKNNKFTFIDNTLVINLETNITSLLGDVLNEN